MTAKWKGGEAIVDAAIAKLKTGMQARVDVINADYDDGVTIKPPDQGSYYNAGKESFLSPAIFVIEGAMAVDRDTEAQHSVITDTRIAVYVADQDADRQKLGKRLARLGRAITEVLWDDPPQEQLTGVGPWAGQIVAFRVAPIATTPGAAFQPEQPDELGAFYIVIFSAKQAEPGA